MANIVKRENNRTVETIPLGAVKTNAAGEASAIGAATVSFTAAVGTSFSTTLVNQLQEVSAFTSLGVGTILNDSAGTGKVIPAGATITAINTGASSATFAPAAAVGCASETIEGINQVKAAGVEVQTIELIGPDQQYDYVDYEYNIVEVSGTPKLVIALEESLDGGKSWSAIEATGYAASAEITAAAKAVQRLNFKEKPAGQRFRVALKFGGAGGVAGYIAYVTDHSPYTAS